MKILMMSLILMLHACGKKEIEPVEKKANATNDIDGDGLSIEQEKKLGSHEQIADLPLLNFKVDDSYQFKLSYNRDGKQNDIAMSASFSNEQSDEFAKATASLLMTPFDMISPLSAEMSFTLSLIERLSKINVDRVNNLILNFYIESNDQKYLVLEAYKINDYFIGDQIVIDKMSPKASHFLKLLYHQKNLFVEVVDYEFEHPVLKSKLQYSELLEKIKKLNAEIVIQDTNSDLKLYASGLELSEILNYHSISTTNTTQIEAKIGQTHFLPSLSRLENRNQSRSTKQAGTLQRKYGTIVSGRESVWTQGQNVLVSIKGSRNVFVTAPHIYPVQKSIISPSGKCTCQLRSIQSSPALTMSHDLLKSLVNVSNIKQVIEIDTNTWLIKTNGDLNWSIPSISANQILGGDINNTCKIFANTISNYAPAKNYYIENELTINLSETQVVNSSGQ